MDAQIMSLILAIIAIIVAFIGTNTAYIKRMVKYQEEYLEEHKKDMKKYDIPQEQINDALEIATDQQKQKPMQCFTGSIIAAIIIAIIVGFSTHSLSLASLALAVVASGFGSFFALSGVKDYVNSKFDVYTCPHCGAILSYFLVEKYRSNEQTFVKMVTKRKTVKSLIGIDRTKCNITKLGSELYLISYQEPANFIRYTEHKNYKCFRCKRQDRKSETKEERV